jgi:tetratricopeptide (TPR) repeat protein
MPEAPGSQPLDDQRTDYSAAIWAAVQRAEWQHALEQWQAAQNAIAAGRLVADPGMIIGAAFALRRLSRFSEADGLLLAASTEFPDNAQIALDRGWLQAEMNQWEAAQARFRAARERHPQVAAAVVGESLMLRRLHLHDDAEALLSEAAERFPRESSILAERASLAQERADWAEAVVRFERAVSVALESSADPAQLAYAESGLATALMQMCEYDRAENVIVRGLQHNPRSLELLVGHAEIADIRRDRQLAIARWQAVYDCHPEHPRSLHGLMNAFWAAGANDDADQLIADRAKDPWANSDIACLYAQMSVRRSDFPEAIRRWRLALAHFPRSPDAMTGLIWSLKESGQIEDARAWLAVGLELHPNNLALQMQLGDLAARQGQWSEAVRHFRAVLDVNPSDPQVRRELRIAEDQLRLADLTSDKSPAGATGSDPRDAPNVRTEADHNLFMDFESLGDNCEFGLVQRHFGAESLGLLRFAGTKTQDLIAALDTRLAGVGDLEHLAIGAWPNGEYSIGDLRYGMTSHTNMYDSMLSREAFAEKQVRRVRFLKNKLLEEFAAASKLFVFKAATVSSDDLATLFAVCRRLGPITLLVVRLTDAEHPAGTVEWASEGLLLGYLDRIPPTEDINSGLSIACWKKICERAHALWRDPLC